MGLWLRAEFTATLKEDLYILVAGVQVTSLGVLEVGINDASILWTGLLCSLVVRSLTKELHCTWVRTFIHQ